MKSETQLCNELGLNPRSISVIRKKYLSRTMWTRVGTIVYYTNRGEHRLRNEIQKKVLTMLDAWTLEVFLLSEYPTCPFSSQSGYRRTIFFLHNVQMSIHTPSYMWEKPISSSGTLPHYYFMSDCSQGLHKILPNFVYRIQNKKRLRKTKIK